MKLPILRVRDADGNIREIPAIQGPQGPKGDTGPQGPKGDSAPEVAYLPIESEDHLGCYYRIAGDGEMEWINPPLEPDIEYRTTGRYKGEVVFAKHLQIATSTLSGGIPETGDCKIPHDIKNLSKVEKVTATYNDRNLLPWFDFGNDAFSLIQTVTIDSVNENGEIVAGGVGFRNKNANWTKSNYTIDIVIYFTKGV